MLTITDQNTKQVQTKYKPDKKNVFTNICSQAARAELESGFTVSIIYINREREFSNNAIEKQCFAKRIRLELTIKYSPKINVIAECFNCLILKKANLLRFKAKLNAEYQDEACWAAIYLQNRDLLSKRAMSPNKA